MYTDSERTLSQDREPSWIGCWFTDFCRWHSLAGRMVLEIPDRAGNDTLGRVANGVRDCHASLAMTWFCTF